MFNTNPTRHPCVLVLKKYSLQITVNYSLQIVQNFFSLCAHAQNFYRLQFYYALHHASVRRPLGLDMLLLQHGTASVVLPL